MKDRRWCSEKVSTCVHDYLIASHQGDLRKALKRRDRGVCAECGHTALNEGWAADHRVPLWSVPNVVTMAERAFYWGLDNAQTLCIPCHTEKTSREAAERACIRKSTRQSAAQNELEVSPSPR